MRVLFVDDDALLRRLGEYALSEVGGMSVELASDGAEALAAVERAAPDAILLDYMMPGMDGDEVLAVLQASSRTRDIPVVFLTAIDNADELQALHAAGAAGYLSKPFDPLTLADDLRSLLRGVVTSTALSP